MDAGFESRAEPLYKFNDQLFSEIASIAGARLLKWMFPQPGGQLAQIYGVPTEVIEVIGYERRAVFLGNIMLCVATMPDVGSAVF